MAKVGRPPTYIDWDHFFKLISYQCSQLEIADFYNCTVETLDARCRAELGESLSAIWDRKISFGRIRLRKAAFDHIERGTPGWAAVLNRIDDKIKLWRENSPLPPTTTAITLDVLAIGNGNKTFAEFCSAAGYFTPFGKQEEMRSFGIDQDGVRLLLGARGYGKTDYVTIMGIAYDLYLGSRSGLDLDLYTNLIMTKSKARNKAIVNEIGHALRKNDVELEKDNSTEIRLKGLIGQDHSVEAITIKTSMRGRHPKRIVMDDPVTDEDTSEAMRVLVKKKYDEAYKLCKNILIIGQPAHFDDLYAHLRDKIPTLCVPHGTIPELDADLSAMKLAGVDPDSIEMSYHLKVPKSSGAIFANMNYIDSFPVGDSFAFMDPSDGGDLTALSIIRGYFSGVAVQGHAMQRPWYHCLDDFVPILVRLGVRRLYFETNKHGEQPVHQLRELLAPYSIGVVGVFSDSNKHAIISAAGSYSHMIHLSRDSDAIYTDRVVKYERGCKLDDPPDSLARGLEAAGLIIGKK